MFREHLPEYRRFMTPQEVIDYYETHDAVLEGYTIMALLEPLAGTSFMSTAIRELISDIETHKGFSTRRLLGADNVSGWFYGNEYPYIVGEVSDVSLRDEAVIAFRSVSLWGKEPFFKVSVKTLPWLKPEEMMVHEGRWDDVFEDSEHTRKALGHTASQWRFYKDGFFVHVIPVSRISYDKDRDLRFPAILPEGFLSHTQMNDATRPLLPFVEPEKQVFRSARTILYISRQFDFDKARRK